MFPIPGADLSIAKNIETLLNAGATAFDSATKQQYWIDDGAIPLAANQAAAQQADSDTLQLPAGLTYFAVFQLGDNDALEAAIQQIAATPGYSFDIDRGGHLIATAQGAPVTPNPFENYIYVTYRAVVEPG